MTLLCNGAVLLTLQQFRALPNYSCTLPTGTTAGKMWRRAARYHRQGLSDEWWQGCFGEPYPEGHRYHGQVPITWRRIVIAGEPRVWPIEITVPLRRIGR